MKVIYRTKIFEESDISWLEDRIQKTTNKWQNDGYEVDIQYSTHHRTFTYYTALMIAYKNESTC